LTISQNLGLCCGTAFQQLTNILHFFRAGGVVGFLEVFSSTEETRESHAADAVVGNLPTREYLPHCHSIRPLCSELGLKTRDYIRQ
ncbi:hypothetical protein GBAR_LOCUS17908, partial [Geodia barretti]